jgi:tRNA(fMet)-specific endonuclease VapC
VSKRYILDTNMLGHLIHDRVGVADRVEAERRSGAVIGTCPPILAEIYFGAENSKSRDANLVLIIRALRGVKIWPFDWDAAKEYGRIATQLRRIGRPMQIPDIQLAAVAMVLGNCIVVTSDSDLSAVPGLRVENWTTT